MGGYRVMLTTLDAPRAISEEPRSCHVASTHLGAANQPATAHLDPATLIVSVAHLHIFMLGMSASKLDILNYVQTANKFIQLRLQP